MSIHTTAIHPAAIIDPKSKIHPSCKIGPYCVIGAEVEIGEGCRLASHVAIEGPTKIGAENRFFPFTSIGLAPQDIGYAGEPTRLEVGDHNVIREFVTISRGTPEGGGVTSGSMTTGIGCSIGGGRIGTGRRERAPTTPMIKKKMQTELTQARRR